MYEERALLLVDLPDVARECPLTDDADMAFLDSEETGAGEGAT